ncbi:hypothetical protein K227x_18100 [Rubripirellula lacrimiformis]|uniref:Uncharacterized protein n=1 Tax=Rubripirellula lacrimiformis TaxID=1930273 RepID=A0A517N8G2_9BACT|nr:hypothetical protein K227x_18100 [Rubripirellula lacrimiformis]
MVVHFTMDAAGVARDPFPRGIRANATTEASPHRIDLVF